MVLQNVKIGIGLTGSFCTFDKVLPQIEQMVNECAHVIPIMSGSASKTDTRFGKAEEFKNKIKLITGNDIVDTIVGAEPLGPNNMIDVMVIAPCTGDEND